MSTLAEIIAMFPNARITINGGGKPRRKSREGDRKYMKRAGWVIRRHQRAYHGRQFIGYMSKNGRPRWEWVAEESLPPKELADLRSTGSFNGAFGYEALKATEPSQIAAISS